MSGELAVPVTIAVLYVGRPDESGPQRTSSWLVAHAVGVAVECGELGALWLRDGVAAHAL